MVQNVQNPLSENSISKNEVPDDCKRREKEVIETNSDQDSLYRGIEVGQHGKSSLDEDIYKNKREERASPSHRRMHENRHIQKNRNDCQKAFFYFLLCDQDNHRDELDTIDIPTVYDNLVKFSISISLNLRKAQCAQYDYIHVRTAHAKSRLSIPGNEDMGKPSIIEYDSSKSSIQSATHIPGDLVGNDNTERAVSIQEGDQQVKATTFEGMHESHPEPSDSGKTIYDAASPLQGVPAAKLKRQHEEDVDSTCPLTSAQTASADNTDGEEDVVNDSADHGRSDRTEVEEGTLQPAVKQSVSGRHSKTCIEDCGGDKTLPKATGSTRDTHNTVTAFQGSERLDKACSKEEEVTNSLNSPASANTEKTDCRERELDASSHFQGVAPPRRKLLRFSYHDAPGQSETVLESETVCSEDSEVNCSTQMAPTHTDAGYSGGDTDGTPAKGSSRVLSHVICGVKENRDESAEPDTKVPRAGADSGEDKRTVTANTRTSSPKEATGGKDATSPAILQPSSSVQATKMDTNGAVTGRSTDTRTQVPLDRTAPQRQDALAMTDFRETATKFTEDEDNVRDAAIVNVIKTAWQGCSPNSKDCDQLKRDDHGNACTRVDLKTDTDHLERRKGGELASQARNSANRPDEDQYKIDSNGSSKSIIGAPKSNERGTTPQDFQSGQDNGKALSRDSPAVVQKSSTVRVHSKPARATATSQFGICGKDTKTKPIEKATPLPASVRTERPKRANPKTLPEGGTLDLFQPTAPSVHVDVSKNPLPSSVPSQSGNSTQHSLDEASVCKALPIDPEQLCITSADTCKSGNSGICSQTPENTESDGGVPHHDGPDDLSQTPGTRELKNEEDEYAVTSADISVRVRGEEDALSRTGVEPEHPQTIRIEGQGEKSVRQDSNVSVPNEPTSLMTSCPASENNSPGTSTCYVSDGENSNTLPDELEPRADSPTEQQPTTSDSMTNENQTCSSLFVREEESLTTNDPSRMLSEEMRTVLANEILECRSPSDSRGHHDSGTETADSQCVGLPFDPVSVIERVKASDRDSLRGSLDSRRFRQARKSLSVNMTKSEKRIHVARKRDPVFITLSLATVHKSQHSSKRTDKRTQPFSMADMQDIHSRRRKKTEQSSSRVEMRRRFEEKLSKRTQDEDDIDILWQTIHNQGRTFHYVLATLPFFPRDEFPPVREQMRLESMRLASFHNFPIHYPHCILRLANAGFFFTGQEGILACHFCGVTFSCDGNSAGLDPYALHRERSPDCPFVRGIESLNLFIQDAQTQASSGRDITGDGSSEPRAHVPQQVQTSRAALASIMADFEAALEAATSPSAATSDTFRLTEPLTASPGDDAPTPRSAEARSNAATGSTDTLLSPGPRTGESSCCLGSNAPLSGPLSNAEQGQTLTRESLSQGQNHGLDPVSSTVTTAPPESEASYASRSQVPVRQPPEVRITTPPENQTRNSTSPQETSHCQQGPGSSSSHLLQNPEVNQRSESNTTSAQLSEPRLGATVQVGANGDPVNNSVTPAAVSSPPSSEPVAVSPLLQASHQVPQRSAQAVCTVTVPMPTLRQDNQATPPSASDTAQSASAYDASGAVHRQYTDLQRRERSFLARWPDTHGQSPEELAVAGFFYTGIGDCVRCHYCGLGLKDWDPNDRPIDEHVRWRSSCGYLQALLGRDVIFRTLARIGQSARGDASSRTDTSESVAAGLASQATGVEDHTTTNARADNSSTSREAEVLMTSEPARKARDMGFPDDVIRQSIVALLHTRAGNRAVTVQNVVHTIFYLRERGQERVEGPEPLAPPSDSESDNDEGSATPSTRGGEDSSPQDRASPQSPGPSNHDQTRAVPSAVARVASGQVQHVHFVLEQHGHSNTVLQSSGSSLSSLSSPSSSTISSSRGSASSSSSFSSRSSSSSGDSGYASSSSSSSSSKDESSTGRGAPRASSLFSSGRLPTITEGAISRKDLRRLEQENQELLERRRCKICLDNDVSILFLPCGHLVCCAECAPALRRCPMCRKRVTATVSIQFSGLPTGQQQ